MTSKVNEKGAAPISLLQTYGTVPFSIIEHEKSSKCLSYTIRNVKDRRLILRYRALILIENDYQIH